MTTHDETLFLVALDRARKLKDQIPWDELEPEECQRIMLDSTLFALNWEWCSFESRDETLEYIAEHCNNHGEVGFFMPEFDHILRRRT